MTALAGRKVTLAPTSTGVPIAGLKTKSVSINNEPIDITSDDDNGFRTFLAEDPANRMIDISAEGVTKDATLIALLAAGGSALLDEYELDMQGFGKFTGDFYIGNIELGMDHKDAITFSCKIQSSGPYVYTPAS